MTAAPTWSAPTDLAAVGVVGMIEVEPTLPTVTADRDGLVHAAWMLQSRANVPTAHGDAARSALHGVWLDNRYGNGEVATATGPADTALPCTRNHGTHAAATLAADGTLWVAWSNTRSGGPAIYLSYAR